MQPIMLITGASRGIGAATAKLAARSGYRVVINFKRQHQAAEQLRQEIQQEGGEAMCIGADIADGAQVSHLFEEILTTWGPVAVLVNNAGVLETQASFDKTSIERWQRIFQTNVFGTMLCCQRAIAQMSTDKGGVGGSIVNVSSLASVIGAPNEYVDYAASKGAIDTFTKGLSKEVAAQGIRVNGVRPGFIYTDMHADGGEAGRVDRLAPLIPMLRGGTAEEVAEAILWLSSDKASYSSGTFIDVAGGR